jgi:hypothetical protein
MPIPAAQNLSVLLYDFLKSRGLLPPSLAASETVKPN